MRMVTKMDMDKDMRMRTGFGMVLGVGDGHVVVTRAGHGVGH